MYFYSVTEGEYPSTSILMYHEKEFTKKEFCLMYNEAVRNIEEINSNYGLSQEQVVQSLCKLYSFKTVEVKYEICEGDLYNKYPQMSTEFIDAQSKLKTKLIVTREEDLPNIAFSHELDSEERFSLRKRGEQ